jgi:hypothetical protein
MRAVLAFFFGDAASVAEANADPAFLRLELLLDARDPVARPAPSTV